MAEFDEQQTSSRVGGVPLQDNRNTLDLLEPDIDVETKLLDNWSITKKDNQDSKSVQDGIMTEDIKKFLRIMPLTEDTRCGFLILRGQFFQRFANQTSYVAVYGIVGCIFAMTDAYFNGTITTIEKRFKIPSRNTGIISVGYDFGQVMVSALLGYYAGKGHRPRWMGFGILTIVAFCVLNAVPHFLYGPGEDALEFAREFGAKTSHNSTLEIIEEHGSMTLCTDGAECETEVGNMTPQVIFFLAQFISGIGGSLYYSLGVSYMDDNTKRSKTPALLSLSYFIRMLGPAVGYVLASFCLRIYIAPQLRPVINDKNPRWLGAWWLGWFILGGMILVPGILLTMFPKELPRAVARRMVEEDRRRKRVLANETDKTEQKPLNAELKDSSVVETQVSFRDMLKTFKRLTTNKTLMYNNWSSVFYFFGYTPYWIFIAKYIEIQYRQSAAVSSMVTGTVALTFSAAGVLVSGFVISKYKPRARYMAAWNVLVGFLTVIGVLAYTSIGCPDNEKSMVVNIHDSAVNNTPTCNSACHCDYVPYSPVCGENGMTYISPCHAGCKRNHIGTNGQKIFYDCSCIRDSNYTAANDPVFERLTLMDLEKRFDKSNDTLFDAPLITLPPSLSTASSDNFLSGQAIPGACPVNCYAQFVTFLAVMCCLKFVGAAGRASNFLVAVRCVPENDKTASIGLDMMMLSLFAAIPSPIFFGWVLDRLCLVWGKTCTSKGNCWLYDPESLRYTLNLTAVVFIIIGTLFDCGVWYYVKDLKIFDDEVKDTEMVVVQHEEELQSED